MSFRRMLPFLLLNVLVSAAVMLAILWWWDGRTPELEPVAAVLQETSPQETLPLDTGNVPLEEVSAVEEPGSQTSAEPGPETHIVQAGDTLGQISLKYDIPVEAIMSANGMDNPNFLAVGQELLIPEEGAPLPEPGETGDGEEAEAASQEGQLPTPIPTEPAVEGESTLAISEVISPGQVTLEAVQIVNSGSREASLRDWKLTDQLGNTYTFGQLTLFGDGAGISIHTGSGQDNATDLFWGLEEALWNSGDRVVLYDDAGTVQAEFQVP